MILPKFEYYKAHTVANAISIYRENKGNARYLAGGTDLIPLVKLRLSEPSAIIDVKGIPELNSIASKDSWFLIGGNFTLFNLKNNSIVKENFPALYESLEATSCETLQMRGTIGGNILQDTRCLEYNKSIEWRTARGFCYKMGADNCNVVPKAKACFSNYCSDNAPALISLSAQVKFVGPDGERTVKLESIYSGDGRKPFLIKDGEIMTEIIIPMDKTKGAYEKLRVRNSMDYPLVGVAVSIKGSSARVCVGGIGLAPCLYNIQNINKNSIDEVAQNAFSDVKPVANSTLSPAYRKKMVGVLIKRAINRAMKEGK